MCDYSTFHFSCLSGPDSSPLDRYSCMDSDSDSCDDCASGTFSTENDGLDSDGDGICDESDICWGRDIVGDFDGDGLCNDVDPCPQDNPDDPDSDGVCTVSDPCPYDNPDDTDNDDICDSSDSCPLDPLNDVDHDLVCAPFDICHGADSSGDSDGDGQCNDLDNCPLTPNNVGLSAQLDSDGDGQVPSLISVLITHLVLTRSCSYQGDACDLCPFHPHLQQDHDSDGLGGTMGVAYIMV